MKSKSEIEAAVRAIPRGRRGFVNRRMPESLINDRSIDACWPWQGAISKRTGYGHANYPGEGGRANAAHRVVYELIVGEIPTGMQIDHICHDPDECAGGIVCPHRKCVNPNHLQAVSPLENTLRSNARSAVNAVKTECVEGHAYSEENTYRYTASSGRPERGCRVCRREAWRKSDRKRRNAKDKYEHGEINVA